MLKEFWKSMTVRDEPLFFIIGWLITYSVYFLYGTCVLLMSIHDHIFLPSELPVFLFLVFMWFVIRGTYESFKLKRSTGK